MWFEITADVKIQNMREYKGKGVVLYITSMVPAKEPADPMIYFS